MRKPSVTAAESRARVKRRKKKSALISHAKIIIKNINK